MQSRLTGPGDVVQPPPWPLLLRCRLGVFPPGSQQAGFEHPVERLVERAMRREQSRPLTGLDTASDSVTVELFARARLEKEEVAILRGMLSAFENGPWKPKT